MTAQPDGGRAQTAQPEFEARFEAIADNVGRVVEKRMRRAYKNPDPLAGQGDLEALARELEHAHPGAAGSLREGLAETFTVARLRVPSTLARTLRSTNCVESMIEIREGAGTTPPT